MAVLWKKLTLTYTLYIYSVKVVKAEVVEISAPNPSWVSRHPHGSVGGNNLTLTYTLYIYNVKVIT